MTIGIRKKITISFALFILASTLIWFLNYYKYQLLTEKLQIIEKKDHAFNMILEARRYEKNFFLFHNTEDLAHSIDYIKLAEARLKEIISVHGRYTAERDLKAKHQALLDYLGALEALTPSPGNESASEPPNDRIRDLGRIMTDDFESMLSQERRQVIQLVHESGYYLYIALAAIFVVTFGIAVFMYFNINTPLKSIETAIDKIASGTYAGIPAIASGDVFESLITSLNHMIQELNRRNEQLVQSEKLASLGTLTSGVAHELNNPLNNISTSVQILLEELEDDNLAFKRELLEETEKQIERARDIVKALLEFSRRGAFNPKPTAFKELVSKTLKMLKGDLPANITLEVDIAEQIRVDLDAQRIQQVLINLIQNGAQAMPDGGRLTISAEPPDGENQFCFRITDTGSGIEKEMQGKIFDPFFTTKTDGRGSGLGLSISHGIIELHKGRITVDSRPGEGTTFAVCLPNRQASETS
ncbi:putative Integral membrane sensor signal transduction histidine kinase [Desulfosarcina cetonica]|uniref:HAMP domain-containing sensor histidine kinase n=1 Tax=Desulfosarcina cetonica TaxID=90730 RepID=UPI0006D08197|nr:ATP-binding protein [Desulfosarcina cetonica]VTR71001.1 putative Integral membrane sensor signal transduction histidine kinase [Desulfosarcina cetonica]